MDIGFKYRSSQKSTDGIGDRIEYFSDAADPTNPVGKVDRKRFYIARLAAGDSSNHSKSASKAGE
jgi:hypothetical protein